MGPVMYEHSAGALENQDAIFQYPIRVLEYTGRNRMLHLWHLSGAQNQNRVLACSRIVGQTLEALWDKSRCRLDDNLEPFWRWKKTPKGKPPGIGYEGWKTSHMWPEIEQGERRKGYHYATKAQLHVSSSTSDRLLR